MADSLYIPIYLFLLGLCVGSFSNVCIYRIPEHSASIIRPGSRCPRCGTPIRFYDNVPVISYILLKGRCRDCGIPIPIRYPFVELLSGLFALAVYLKFGLSLEALVYYAMITSLLIITFIDIDHQIIPNVITLPGIPIAFLLAFLLPDITWAESLVGLFAGGGSLYFIAMAYQWLKKKEGMGMGDIKLLAMIGTLIGLKGVIFTIFVSSAVGTLSGLILILAQRIGNLEYKLPYGPFLAIGAITYVFWGPEIILWYLLSMG